MGVTVMIVEDEPLFRDMLKATLASDPDISVVASFGDADAVLAGIGEIEADVVTLDIQIPGRMNGFELGLVLREKRPKLGIVLLSNYREPAFISALRRRRLTGWSYLLKKSVADIATLKRAVKGAAAGDVVLDPGLTVQMRARAETGVARLTPRQLEILQLIAQGFSNRAIADQLRVSTKTVENTINQIYQELEIDSKDPSIQPRVTAVMLYLSETHIL